MNVETLKTDLKTAMKAKDSGKVQVIRMLLTEVAHNKSSAEEPSSDDVLKAVRSYYKKLGKAIDDTSKAGGAVDALRLEASIVKDYLPQEASREAHVDAVNKAFETVEIPNMGSVMKVAKALVGSGVNNKLLSELIRDRL